jgi:hypothetical protein
LLSSQMRSCPDSCRMMKRIPSVGFDCDCAGQTCLPSNHYPTFRSAPGWPTWRHCRKSFVPHKPWPEPLVFSAPPPCLHRSPLQARSTPSLQPRTPALVGSYTASGPYPIATSFARLCTASRAAQCYSVASTAALWELPCQRQWIPTTAKTAAFASHLHP